MIKTTFIAGLLLTAVSLPAFAASTAFYVEQDAKSRACMVSDKKPDGKTTMDVGTKTYDSKANAQKAMAKLKACETAATPAGFYVAEDAKTKKCAVSDKKPDGKMMMDVGTKMYDSKANAEKAMANLAACK
jgi:uncharacterized protein YegP (UPF0339 family)